MTLEESIKFGRRIQPFFELSPYYYRGFTVDGKVWRTLIHYWCGSYFNDRYLSDYICRLNDVNVVLAEGKRNGLEDFDKVPSDKILLGIKERFRQNDDLKLILMSTGNCTLVYDGVGFLADNNRYGRVLMKLRDRYNLE